MQYSLIGYMVSFLALFSNFYIHAYFAKRYTKQEPSKANGEAVANGEVVANGVVTSPLLEERKKLN